MPTKLSNSRLKTLIAWVFTSFLVLFLVGSNSQTYSQTFKSDWETQFGSSDQDDCKSLPDAEGNVYVTGFFFDSLILPTQIPDSTFTYYRKGWGIFYGKLDHNGSLIWFKIIENSGHAWISNLFQVNDSTWGIGGMFNDSIFLEDTFVSQAFFDVFLFTFGPNGKVRHNITYGGSRDQHLSSVSVDSFGDINLHGIFSGKVDFDPGGGEQILSSLDGGSHYWLKLNLQLQYKGVLDLTRTNKTENYINHYASDVDSRGNNYIHGSFRGEVFFDFDRPNDKEIARGTQDAMIAKYNRDMKLVWYKTVTSSDLAAIEYIDIDIEGNIYASLIFNDSLFINGDTITSATPSRQLNAALVRFDSNGNILNHHHMPCTNVNRFNMVHALDNGKVCITGFFRGSIILGTAVNAERFYETNIHYTNFAAQYTKDLQLEYATLMPAEGWYYLENFFVTPTNKWHFAGNFYGPLSTTGEVKRIAKPASTDALWVQLNPCVTFGDTIRMSACGAEYAPRKNFLMERSGIYIDTLINKQGCDSLIPIAFTLKQSYTDSSSVSACDSLFWEPSQTWFYEDTTVRQGYTATNGCDSIVIAQVQISASHKWVEDINACDSFEVSPDQIVRESGQFEFKHVNQNGCDSIVRLNITIHNLEPIIDSVETCEEFFIWSKNGVRYRDEGRFQHTKSGPYCDSLFILDLDFLDISPSIIYHNDTLRAKTVQPNYKWISCNGDELPNNQQSTYVPIQSGWYALVTTDGNCTDTSECIEVRLPHNLCSTRLKVYPNPSNGTVHLNMGRLHEHTRIELFDAAGRRLIEEEIFNSQTHQIETGFSTGIYFIRIETEEGLCDIQKIVLSK